MFQSLQVSGTLALAPTIVLGVAALLVLVVDSIDPDSSRPTLLAGLSVGGALVALVATGVVLVTNAGQAVDLFGGQLVVDGMSLFFTLIFTSVTALVCLASYDYLAGQRYKAEYYSLVLLAATGMSLMAAANSLATIFVSLELASLPSYALVAFLKGNRGSVEAGLKYFLIGALSSAVFVYGISLVYGVTGHLSLPAIAEALQGGVDEGLVGVLGIGVLMIIGGFAYKTASVPFHFWAPEAYEGAPAPISAFLSSASKAAGFVIAFRAFTVAFPQGALGGVDWVLTFQILALVTMTLGNFAAATQENVKRMLAYSSIGHAGYVLIALAALTGNADTALVLGAGMIHLVVYGFMNTGAFLFIALAEYWGVGRTFEDYNGLGSKAPVASVAMTVFLFNLAGLPIGAGFLSKYFLLLGAVSGATVGTLILAAALIVNSALSLFYYSRIVKALWFEEAAGEFAIDGYPTGLYAAIVAAAVVTVLLLPALGFFSDTAFEAAATMVGA
ncbi:NADH-quinone oxidoreductase subunit N [Halomarina litorea]|uniref:NADH-quinone oxidoreductase subunit N n=1 Tax=Halomarina litorea TaxID=2961595 RepID=UPI0020C1F2E8|nr:NADH-quinone oxidoreductase subunit N [Halomarina sp. BCD28]